VRRIAFCLAILAGFPQAIAAVAADKPTLTFERDIRPIFKTNCFQCHGETGEKEGSLDLRLQRFAAAGGDSGPALVPGKADESLLVARIRAGEMPPGKHKLSADEIEKIARWIDAGAKTARPEPATLEDSLPITAEDRAFWAFQPIAHPEPPKVKQATRVRTPIDAFLLAELEREGLAFASDADKAVLIRRATLDLHGLPPTPAEVDAFVADGAPDAYERLIDRLLASPHYGERWGRHWLDVAGYADSEGYTETDPPRPHAWRYRDYVIRSLNEDKPFDRFIVEQLAGDELVKPPYKNLSEEAIEQLVATGYLRMAPDGTASGGVDKGLASNQVVSETMKIVSSSLLGLTVGCAECHDHRYDPISQADYYRLRAIFEPAFNTKNWRVPQARLVSLYTDEDRAKANEINAEAAKIDAARLKRQEELMQEEFDKALEAKVPEEKREEMRSAWSTPAAKRNDQQKKLLKEYPGVNVTPGSLYLFNRKAADELKKMVDEAAKIRATKPVEEFVQALTEVPGKIPDTFLYARGDYEQPKQKVEPAELRILCGEESLDIAQDDKQLPTSGRRLAYAQWLTNGEHPLTARVLVNRVWMHHFGRGIVATPADFGTLGQRPSHPELLDWLASTFMDEGWRLKSLHKRIMTSTAYRQSSHKSEQAAAIDPDNRLLSYKSLQRLDAETLRDSLLATSGKLNDKMFGEPVPVMADEVGQFVVGKENLNAGRPQGVIPLGGEEFRRSIYIQARRSRPLSVMSAFDAPTMEPNCQQRNSSTVAPQSLLLLNNKFVMEQSEAFAQRVRKEAGESPEDQVRLAWRLAMGTTPEQETLTGLVAFLDQQSEHFRAVSKDQPAAKEGPKNKGKDKDKDKKSDSKPKDPQLLALANLCQALWSSNQFLYVE
jgi:mono/diheme cytochrome c family protein